MRHESHEDGHSFKKGYGDRDAANQDAIVASIHGGRWDGGDW